MDTDFLGGQSLATFRPLPQVPSSLLTQPDETARRSLQVIRPRDVDEVEKQDHTVKDSMLKKVRKALTKLKPSTDERKTSLEGPGGLPSRLFLDDFEYVERPDERMPYPRPHTANDNTPHRQSSGLWSQVAHAMQPSQPVKGLQGGSSPLRSVDHAESPIEQGGGSKTRLDLLKSSATKLLVQNRDHTLDRRPTMAELDAQELRKRLEDVRLTRLPSRALAFLPAQRPDLRPVASARDSLAAKMLDPRPSQAPNVLHDGKTTKSDASPLDDGLHIVNENKSTGIRKVTYESFARALPGRQIRLPPLHDRSMIEAELSFLSNVDRGFVMPQLGHPNQIVGAGDGGNTVQPHPPPLSSSYTYSSNEEDAATMDSRMMDVFSRVQEWRAKVAAMPAHTVFAPSASNSHLDNLLHVSRSSDLTSVSRRVEIGQYVGDGLRARQTGEDQLSILDESILQDVDEHASIFAGVLDGTGANDPSGKTQEHRTDDHLPPLQFSSSRPALPDHPTPIDLLKSQIAQDSESLPARISFQGSPDDLIKLFKGSICFSKEEERSIQHHGNDLLIDTVSDHVPPPSSPSKVTYGTSHIRQLSAKDSQALMEMFERNSTEHCLDSDRKADENFPAKMTTSASSSRMFLEEALKRLALQIDRITDVAELHRAFTQLQQDLLRLVPDETGQTAIMQRLNAIEQILFIPA
jgi:hypothetical protein